MKLFENSSFPILVILFLFTSCGLYRSQKEFDYTFNEIENPILVHKPNPNFPLPEIPENIVDRQERAIYLSKYYWNQFPFEDATLIGKTEITEQAFVDYIHILKFIPSKDAKKSMKYLFAQAQGYPDMYAYFASLFEKYYYSADSPFCNEELYIPVLETILKSTVLSEEDFEKYDFQKEMIHKNRVGSKATDFMYISESGNRKWMHSLKSNYLILFFSTPECDNCLSIANDFQQSEVLKKVCSFNNYSRTMLAILHISPTSGTPLWKEYIASMPQNNWIHGYDASKIIKKRMYDLKKLPTIYLLDNKKRIILKGTSLEEIESYFLSKE